MSTSRSEYLYSCGYETKDSEYSNTDSTPMDPPAYTNLQDFVRGVYRLSDDELESITSKTWQLRDASVSEYQEAVQAKSAGEMSTAFRRIMNDLFVKLRADGRDLRVSIEALQRTKASRELSHGFFGADSPVRWSTCKAFLELRISSDRRQPVAQPFPAESSCSSDHSAATSAQGTPQTTSSPVATKRKLRSGDERYEPTSRKRFRYDLYKRREPPQAAGRALELMSATCRRWATGLVVEDTCVWAQYYDRMGPVFSEPFDFVDEPTKLALLALAIGKCGLVEAGFEPYLASDIGTAVTRPLPSLGGAELLIPQADGQAGKDIVIVQGIPNECYSHFKITGDALFTYSAVGGRGTHVLPGYLVNVPSKESSEGQRAHGANALVGESNTAVDTSPNTNASKDTARRDLLPKAMVAKLSWPAASRARLEAETLISLHERIPWMRRHLPFVHCAVALKGKAMNLPRDLFRDMTTAHKLEQRYFTLLFTDCYQHLWDVKTLDDFQMAYIGIVECHYAATRYGKMLHRDISENNLLWTRETKRVVGVLNDWDLATPVDAIGNSTNHRTGTGPFMALDLLGKVPPVHLYRHDLESLFYVLIWAAVHYNIGDAVPYSRVVHAELTKWDGNYGEAHDAKSAFLCKPTPVLECIRPAWDPLRAAWLEPLCDLFQKAHFNACLLASAKKESSDGQTSRKQEAQRPKKLRYSDDESDEENEDLAPLPKPASPQFVAVNVDFETLGGYLTFENFMAALGGWVPRGVPKNYRDEAERLLAAK